MNILLDYCQRGKVEHLIRMRERLDCHSRYLEAQIAGLEALVKERGESDVVVPPLSQMYGGTGAASKPRTMSEGSGGELGASLGSNRSQGSTSLPQSASVDPVSDSSAQPVATSLELTTKLPPIPEDKADVEMATTGADVEMKTEDATVNQKADDGEIKGAKPVGKSIAAVPRATPVSGAVTATTEKPN